jgi:hypothetical protein
MGEHRSNIKPVSPNAGPLMPLIQSLGRYTWNVVLPTETKEGFDYFEFNEQYQITRLVSFFGPLT